MPACCCRWNRPSPNSDINGLTSLVGATVRVFVRSRAGVVVNGIPPDSDIDGCELSFDLALVCLTSEADG